MDRSGCEHLAQAFDRGPISILASVLITLVKAGKASAPWAFFEHCDTFQAITAGRSALGPVVGRLNLRRLQKAEKAASIRPLTDSDNWRLQNELGWHNDSRR